MKKLSIIVTLFVVTLTSYSQSLGYKGLGILFSQNDENGSARFTSMSGAFGALGGDISSININPAGIAVFKNSSFSATFNSRGSDITSKYYGNSLTTQNQYFSLSHAGAVLVFDSAYSSDWTKFAIGFNYRIKKDFTNGFLAKGNSGVATFTEFPLDTNNPKINYNIANEQRFDNNYGGELDELNFAFSSEYLNKLYVGLGLSFYDLKFSQKSNLTEFNNDGNGNNLESNFYQENITKGTGFSANAGFIYKVLPSFRLGVSYQTPTWYTEVLETTNITNNNGFLGDTKIIVNNDNNNVYDNTAGRNFPSQELLYRLKTPSKLTASAAFIFGKIGLLSFDYTNKNYQNIKLSNGVFTDENQFFQNQLRNTSNFNIGTEWRLDRFSIRGGYRFEESPYKSALKSDNLKGYSLGAGYNFGSFKLDFSYSDNNKTSFYDIYPQYSTQVNTADLQTDNKVFTATVTFNL